MVYRTDTYNLFNDSRSVSVNLSSSFVTSVVFFDKMGVESTLQSLDVELDQIFNSCSNEKSGKVPAQSLIQACVAKYAGGDVDIRNFISEDLDPSSTNELVSRNYFKDTMKNFMRRFQLPENDSTTESQRYYESDYSPVTSISFDFQQSINKYGLDNYFRDEDYQRYKSLEATKRKLKDINLLLEKSLEKSDERIQTLQKELNKITYTTADKMKWYECQMNDLQKLLSESQEECTHFKEMFAEAIKEKKSLKEEITSLRKTDTILLDMERSLQCAKEELIKKDKHLNKINKHTSHLCIKLECALKENSKIQNENDTLKCDINALQENQNELLNKIEKLKSNYTQLQLELSEVKAAKEEMESALMRSSETFPELNLKSKEEFPRDRSLYNELIEAISKNRNENHSEFPSEEVPSDEPGSLVLQGTEWSSKEEGSSNGVPDSIAPSSQSMDNFERHDESNRTVLTWIGRGAEVKEAGVQYAQGDDSQFADGRLSEELHCLAAGDCRPRKMAQRSQTQDEANVISTNLDGSKAQPIIVYFLKRTVSVTSTLEMYNFITLEHKRESCIGDFYFKSNDSYIRNRFKNCVGWTSVKATCVPCVWRNAHIMKRLTMGICILFMFLLFMISYLKKNVDPQIISKYVVYPFEIQYPRELPPF